MRYNDSISTRTKRLFKYVYLSTLLANAAIAAETDNDARKNTSGREKAYDWLDWGGEFRLRYESLDGQFRASRSGSDQLLAARTLAHLNARFNKVSFGFELQDSRTYLDDEGTPLSTSFVNTLEFINLNADINLSNIFNFDSKNAIKIGRQTVDVGSERFIERNGYRNTINSYDGFHFRNTSSSGNSLEFLAVAPVRAEPRESEDLAENNHSFDKTDDAIHFWGAIYTNKDGWLNQSKSEVFAYGLNEKDTNSRSTADREIYTLGFRTLKNPIPGRWDYELEYAYQFGSRLSSTEPSTANTLDVTAQTLHAELAYTFDAKWQPRVAFELDYASGDKNPNDNTFESYDRMFGARRGDVGFTSIHGPLVRNNLLLLGFDFEFKFSASTDGFINFQRAYLDSASDELDAANLRDIDGNSGTHIGDTVDFRIRHWLNSKKLRWDFGASALFNGKFLENVDGGPADNRTIYAFTQVIAKF